MLHHVYGYSSISLSILPVRSFRAARPSSSIHLRWLALEAAPAVFLGARFALRDGSVALEVLGVCLNVGLLLELDRSQGLAYFGISRVVYTCGM